MIAMRLKVIDIFRWIIVGQGCSGLVRRGQVQQNDIICRGETNIFCRQTPVDNIPSVQGMDGDE